MRGRALPEPIPTAASQSSAGQRPSAIEYERTTEAHGV
jgi:hypothetical protein